MLLANATVGVSAIHGFGLFAEEPIPKGSLIWKFEPSFDQSFTPEQLSALPQQARQRVIDYCYRCMDTGNYILCIDDARFMNHSDDPNTYEAGGGEGEQTIAARDIAAGEEITCDYYTFDADCDEKLGSPEKRRGK